jgi:basic membrane lipoprotein Med (substrate-binding protein (PBP1-ABC) superfamily)
MTGGHYVARAKCGFDSWHSSRLIFHAAPAGAFSQLLKEFAMTLKSAFRLTALACVVLGSQALLAEPAVVFDMGGKFDKSFNEAAYNGMEKWKKETGKKYLEFEISNESQREQALRRMAEKGASPDHRHWFRPGIGH